MACQCVQGAAAKNEQTAITMATTGAIAYFAQGKTEELGPGDLVVDAGSGNKIEKEQALDVVNAGEDGGFHGLETAMFRR